MLQVWAQQEHGGATARNLNICMPSPTWNGASPQGWEACHERPAWAAYGLQCLPAQIQMASSTKLGLSVMRDQTGLQAGHRCQVCLVSQMSGVTREGHEEQLRGNDLCWAMVL